MSPNLGDRVRCEQCGKEFETDWTDEEARAESRALFGDRKPEDLAVICDTCWKAFGFEGGNN